MLDEIQPGWKVVAVDGKDLGIVLKTTKDGILVKTTVVSAGELLVPTDSVAEVETGRVDLSVTRDEVAAKA
jgi:hypothetical protein